MNVARIIIEINKFILNVNCTVVMNSVPKDDSAASVLYETEDEEDVEKDAQKSEEEGGKNLLTRFPYLLSYFEQLGQECLKRKLNQAADVEDRCAVKLKHWIGVVVLRRFTLCNIVLLLNYYFGESRPRMKRVLSGASAVI